jgi:uncharacterized protein (TIGR03067 family)
MWRYSPFLALVILALPAGQSAPAAEDGSDLVGTWSGTAGGFKELWTIQQDKGAWSVSGVFKSGEAVVGAFRGVDVQYNNGTLTFRQDYIRKPAANWPNGNRITAKVSGDKISFTWRSGKQSGSGSLTKGAGEETKKAEPVPELSAEAKAELAKLDGKWDIMTFVFEGKAIQFGAVWEFKKGNVAEFIGLSTPRRQGPVVVDPEKTPKTIDLNFNRAEGGGQKALYKGVYELDGDALKLCCGTDGSRPKELASPEGTKTFLLVLKRKK